MDAISYLKGDHEEVLAMLARLEQQPVDTTVTPADLEGRRTLVTDLVIAESRHEAVEEEYFWPAVADSVPGGDQLAAQATEQEQRAKHVLAKLDHCKATDPEFENLIAEIITAGREHISYEEQQVWPAVQQTLSPERLDELGEQLAQAKENAPTRPHPHTPPKPGVLKTAGAGAAMMDKARDAVTGRGRS